MPQERYKQYLTEKQVGQQIVDYCKITHIPIFRNNVGATRFTNKDGRERFVRFGEAGMPDYSIIIFHKGLPLAGYVETKREKGGKQSEDQKRFEAWCREKGIFYVVAHSLDEFQQGLTEYKSRL